MQRPAAQAMPMRRLFGGIGSRGIDATWPSARLRACRCRSSLPSRRSSQDRRRHRCRASRCANHPPRCRRAGGEEDPMRLPATFVIAACLLAAADDGAAAFTPDGATVYFMRGTDSFTLVESHRVDGRWSTPRAAPFSGRWRDLDPAMAPDGSYLLFVSNRPARPGGAPIDETHAGQHRAGQGMNLWRVDRRGDGWDTPVRLPDIVNRCSTTFAPSIAADGSIYFIGCAAPDDSLRLMRAVYRD